MKKMMIDQKWEDTNGRKHKLYVVRSMGAGRGFGVIEFLRNFVVGPDRHAKSATNTCVRLRSDRAQSGHGASRV